MFSRDKSASARPGAKAGAKVGKGAPAGLSFIGPEVVINGSIATQAQLHIDGRVEGDVSCVTLCQGNTGTIAGNIIAEQARLAGLVDGTVAAKTVVLEPSARITGDVSYETISIAAGARIDGRLSRKESAEADTGPKLIATAIKPGAGGEGKASELFPRPETPKAAAAGGR